MVGAAASVMVKLSVPVAPALSRAVTSTEIEAVPAGSVPVKLLLAAVNCSQDGRAAPPTKVAA